MQPKKERNILDHVALLLAIPAAVALLLFYIKGAWTASYAFPEYRRSIIFVAALYITIVSYLNKRSVPFWTFLAVAVLYNPLSVSFFSKGWVFLDIFAMIAFIFLR